MKIHVHNNTDKLMDNLRIDEIQVYGAPDDIHVVYLDYFTQFYDYDYENVSTLKQSYKRPLFKLIFCF